MSTTLGEERATGRALRCRYLRRNGERCGNELAANPDEPEQVLLCAKHLFKAWRQFAEHAKQAREAAG